MICDGCGFEHAASLRYTGTGNEQKCVCDECSPNALKAGIPDVYFNAPYFDENLGDEKHPQGQFIESKEHKKAIMKEQNLVEAGDRKHGARNFEKGFGNKDGIL